MPIDEPEDSEHSFEQTIMSCRDVGRVELMPRMLIRTAGCVDVWEVQEPQQIHAWGAENGDTFLRGRVRHV
jgi:hypothetical protein